jgi:hypothetical protein
MILLGVVIYFISLFWLIWLFNYLTKIGVKGYEKQMLAFYIPVVNTIAMLISWLKLLLGLMNRLTSKKSNMDYKD